MQLVTADTTAAPAAARCMTKTTPCARQRDLSSVLQTVAPLALFNYVANPKL